MYRNGVFKFHITVPLEYNMEVGRFALRDYANFKPPQVKCLTKVWHPNITEDGQICLSLLRKNGSDQFGWMPTRNITEVLSFLYITQIESICRSSMGWHLSLRTSLISKMLWITKLLNSGQQIRKHLRPVFVNISIAIIANCTINKRQRSIWVDSKVSVYTVPVIFYDFDDILEWPIVTLLVSRPPSPKRSKRGRSAFYLKYIFECRCVSQLLLVLCFLNCFNFIFCYFFLNEIITDVSSTTRKMSRFLLLRW